MEQWVVTAKGADFTKLAQTFSIDPVTARILRNREVVGDLAIRQYLEGGLSDLNSPALLKDAIKTCGILLEKIKNHKKIRIIGDYDIDGIMSSYLLYRALKDLGAEVDVAIPERMTDGYGLNERLIKQAAHDGIDTVLTCDNGIAAANEIRLGKEMGLTILVTDHHEVPYIEIEEGGGVKQPPYQRIEQLPLADTIVNPKQGGSPYPYQRIEQLPCADAIVNPKQVDCPYPYKNLCGAAVAYKLMELLYETVGKPKEAILEYLQYAAFATVGDVMELTGENRIIVKEGLARLQRTENLGLLALLHVNEIAKSDIKAYHIGFVLGPCFNASGRLDTAIRAFGLLNATDEETARSLAKDLLDLNISRKEMTALGVEEATVLAEEAVATGDKVLVLFLPDCHESLAGIIAGRIRERYHRPVFVLTKGQEGVKGSGRSTESYSMYEEMSKCKDLFVKYGGHPMAAGLSMETEEHIALLRKRLNEQTNLSEDDLRGKIKIDVPMPISYISTKLIEELERLEPFGKGNEKPIFADRKLKIRGLRILGKNRNVLKLVLESETTERMEGIYFGDATAFQEELRSAYGDKALTDLLQGNNGGGNVMADFLYYPKINRYQGRESLQVEVKGYRFCGSLPIA
ncbi:single-stranded-DNA-specific exonuclease RecJ [Clostridia bacterium]|nr:single-stranded-DNA-specific exonuclease RecJ [Clostridia bacterium]